MTRFIRHRREFLRERRTCPNKRIEKRKRIILVIIVKSCLSSVSNEKGIL